MQHSSMSAAMGASEQQLLLVLLYLSFNQGQALRNRFVRTLCTGGEVMLKSREARFQVSTKEGEQIQVSELHLTFCKLGPSE